MTKRPNLLERSKLKVMAITTIYQTMNGQTTIETYLERGGRKNCDHISEENAKTRQESERGDERTRYLCVPSAEGRCIHEILPSDRLYDLGWKENIRAFLSQEVFPDLSR